MHFRFVISLIVAAISTPAIFAQGTNQLTVDELVAKNTEAKGMLSEAISVWPEGLDTADLRDARQLRQQLC